MYIIKHELHIFRISHKKKKGKKEEQNRFIGQRSYAYHTHIPTTNTHTHACTGGVTKKKKRLIINYHTRPDKCTNNNGQACKLCSINICELHVNESGLLFCAICIVTIINRKKKGKHHTKNPMVPPEFCRDANWS